MGPISRRLVLALTLVPTLAAAQTVRGRVLDASNREPIADARIELRDEADKVLKQVLTSGSGTYQFAVPRAGAYQVRLASIGYAPGVSMRILVSKDGLVVNDILLERAGRSGDSGISAVSAGGAGAQFLPPIVTKGLLVLGQEARLHQLWDVRTGVPISLVTYSIKFGDIATKGSGDSRVARIDLHLRQDNPPLHQSRDTVVKLKIASPERLGDHPTQTGFLIVPALENLRSWTLIATQPGNESGSGWQTGHGRQPPAPLRMSDLVVGAKRQNLVWERPEGDVMLAPLDGIDREDEIHLFYQLRSSEVRLGVHTSLKVYRAGETKRVLWPTAEPVLTVEFDSRANAGVTEVDRQVDFRQLVPGPYWVVLYVEHKTGSGGVATGRGTMIVLK